MGSLIYFGASDPLLLWGWSCCVSEAAQVPWGWVRFPRAYSHMYPLTIPPSLTSEMFFASRGTHSLVLRAPPKLFTSGNSFGLLFNSYYSSSSARNLTYFYLWSVLLWWGISETWKDLPKAHSFPTRPFPFLSGPRYSSNSPQSFNISRNSPLAQKLPGVAK